MIQIGIADLEARLHDLLERVRQGEEIMVVDGSRPVARLIPPELGAGNDPQSRLLDLERSGLVRIGTGTLPDDLWDIERPEDPQGLVRAALEAERSQGR